MYLSGYLSILTAVLSLSLSQAFASNGICYDEKGNVDKTSPDCQKKFILFTTRVTWNQALKNCEAEGMELASFKNRFEEIRFKDQRIREGKTRLTFWLGGIVKRRRRDLTWIVDGKKARYTGSWSFADPDDPNSYVCQYYGETRYY